MEKYLHQLIDIENIEYAARRFQILSNIKRGEIINLLLQNGALSLTHIYTKLGSNQNETSVNVMLMYRYGFLKRERQGKTILFSVNMELVEELVRISEELYFNKYEQE